MSECEPVLRTLVRGVQGFTLFLNYVHVCWVLSWLSGRFFMSNFVLFFGSQVVSGRVGFRLLSGFKIAVCVY